MNFTISGKELAEWGVDLLGAFFVFWILRMWLMDAELNILEQPWSTLATLGGTALAFKVLRKHVAFSK